jgi:hypothetical protein
MQKLVADSNVDRLCVRASGSHEYARYRKSVADQATPTVHVGSVVQALRRVKRSPSSSGVASILADYAIRHGARPYPVHDLSGVRPVWRS